MRLVLLAVAVLAVLLISYSSIALYLKVQVSKTLVLNAKKYERLTQDYNKTLLVLGDSTGVGVGVTSPEESVAGLLAQEIKATYVENHAVSGATVSDLSRQSALASLPHYDYILIQIGGNDIIAFRRSTSAAMSLEPILETLAKKGSTVVLLSAGNVGAAPIFPLPLRPFYTALNQLYHRTFEVLARKVGVIYVNLYAKPTEDPFVINPEAHFSRDFLHPSSAGYRVWFERLKEVVGQQAP